MKKIIAILLISCSLLILCSCLSKAESRLVGDYEVCDVNTFIGGIYYIFSSNKTGEIYTHEGSVCLSQFIWSVKKDVLYINYTDGSVDTYDISYGYYKGLEVVSLKDRNTGIRLFLTSSSNVCIQEVMDW